MTSAVATRGYTVDRFLALPDSDRYELIDGCKRERDMSADAVWVSSQFSARLIVFNDTARLGLVFGDGLPLEIFPLRPKYMPRPDGAYISYERLGQRTPPDDAITVAPELVIEVISTHEKANEIEGKVREYLRAGVNLVWVAYPDYASIHVFRADGSAAVLTPPAELSGEDILPGFSIPVARLFPPAS